MYNLIFVKNFKATGFQFVFKLSQLITFYSEKKPIYVILCVIKQHADSTRVKQATFHKS